MLKEYHKIKTLFERDEKTKKLVEGKYRNEAIKYLKDNQWQFTEKIDGTNIRIYWDGHRVSFYGRTDKAQIPANLMNRLVELFGGETNEQLFEQKFGETEVILYGEGYGEKIQNGGLYRKGQDFILFDVMIADNYQSRESVEDIAKVNTYIELVLEKDYCNCNELNTILGKHCDGSKNVAYALEHILSDYKRVLKENEKLKALDSSNSKMIANMSKRHFQDREKIRNSIPVQKVKDKIEELKKKVEELTDDKGYWGGSDLLEQIEVLQELLEKEQ